MKVVYVEKSIKDLPYKQYLLHKKGKKDKKKVIKYYVEEVKPKKNK
jgi:hypothetical protein